jgi:IS30 family transposase
LKAKQPISEIARLLGSNRSSISREFILRLGLRGCRVEQACTKEFERAKNRRHARRVDPKVWADVDYYLGIQWSPEQIAGKMAVNHESVYLHVYANKAADVDLHAHLRSQKPQRKRHLCELNRRGQIPNNLPISERPSHIEDRKQVGHWEGATVIGAAHKQAIVTLVERKSGFALLAEVFNKKADLVGRAFEAKIMLLNSRVKTLTVNNGKEFADYQAIDEAIGIQTYFADPYCSWQHGSNENFNGLLCQYIPKKRRMETVNDEELTMIQNRLNHRPRKRLGFKTPHVVFHASLNRVAVRPLILQKNERRNEKLL